MRIGGFVIVALLAMSGAVHAEDPFNYARLWQSWSPETKTAYLTGMTDGILYGSTQFHVNYTGTNKVDTNSEDFQKIEKALQATVLYFENESLIPVLDSLYKDPANSFIACRDMALLARDKLKGVQIEASLQKARKDAIYVHEFNEKQRNR